jgi:hypothetical protein
MKQFSSLIYLLLVGLFPQLVVAQGVQYLDAPTEPISISSSEFEVYVYFNLYNSDTTAVELFAERTVNNLAAGHESLFCWDICYDVSKDISDSTITIAAGDTTGFPGRYLILYPNGQPGYSEVTMRFYSAAKSGTDIEHTFAFSVDGVTSNEAAISGGSLSAPYPNPARNLARIDYQLPGSFNQGQLKVFNLIGKAVLQQPLSQPAGTAELNVSQLPSGVYFLYLYANGQEWTSRKLIISH